MSGRFDYVKYDQEAMIKQSDAKGLCQDLETFISERIPTGRATALAITKLEEVYMWIGKAIRDEQVIKRGAELQEGRNDE
jgi:hypothetical protein